MQNPTSRLLDEIPGVGTLIASVIAASVPDPGVFKSGRDFAAWLGLTPRQHSSGGKEKLGSITKQGNRYIRKMSRSRAQLRCCMSQASAKAFSPTGSTRWLAWDALSGW